jgi:hypothetical protein
MGLKEFPETSGDLTLAGVRSRYSNCEFGVIQLCQFSNLNIQFENDHGFQVINFQGTTFFQHVREI